MEGRSLALYAGGPDTPAMLVDDAATDRQPQPGSSKGARIRGVALLKAVEDVLELIGGNASALVAYLDEGLAARRDCAR